MAHCAKRLSALLLAVLSIAIVTVPAFGEPLVWVSVLGRVQGSGQEYSSVVEILPSGSPTQVLEYMLVAELAPVGTYGAINYAAGVPVYGTITSLKASVTTTTGSGKGAVVTTTYYDGINNLKFNLSQSPTTPIQVDLDTPSLVSEWLAGGGASPGTYSTGPRKAGLPNGLGYDVMNIRPIAATSGPNQDTATLFGVPTDGQHVPVVLGTGTATILTAPAQAWSELVVSDKLPVPIGGDNSGIQSAGIIINGGTQLTFAATTDADPIIGFHNLFIQTPEPATIALLTLGLAGALAARRPSARR